MLEMTAGYIESIIYIFGFAAILQVFATPLKSELLNFLQFFSRE